MLNPTHTTPELDEVQLRHAQWKESIGKVFKLVSKSYGLRTVVYTQIKAVTEADSPGDFDIQVLCAEITARVLSSKRAHSSACKEGTIHHAAESLLLPSGFGDECQPQEFEKVAAAILAHATTILDLVMQLDPEEKTTIDVPIDLPHLRLTDMEASLVRNSPFLIRDIYLLSPNSRKAAFESINQELQRATRTSRLTDSADPVYVAQKNEAILSLQIKLNGAAPEINSQRGGSTSADSAPLRIAQRSDGPVAPKLPIEKPSAEAQEMKAAPATNSQPTLSAEKRDSITLALLGKPSAAILFWERLNPSSEGAVFRLGKDCGLLAFIGWAHVSGRAVTEQEIAGKKVRNFFNGVEGGYTGPDKQGVYPAFKL